MYNGQLSHNGWCMLFYDKYAGDHSYKNKITRKITLEHLFKSSEDMYKHLEGDQAIKTYNDAVTENCKFKSINENFYRVHLFISQKSPNAMYIVIGINIEKFSGFIIENNYNIAKCSDKLDMNFFDTLCRYHLNYYKESEADDSTINSYITISQYDSKKISIVVDKIIKSALTSTGTPTDPTIDDPDCLTTKLFNYQKRSIKWMVDREKNIKPINYSLNDEIPIGDIYYDINRKKFNQKNNRDSLMFYGGGLIDEVGLGKTFQITVLSILRQPEVSSYIQKNVDSVRLFSRATLVICPNQLCGQWKRELQKMISKSYNPTIISSLTKVHFDKYTYQDLLDADFVILSYSFLDNNAFLSKWMPLVNTSKNYHKQESQSFDDIGKDLVNNPIKTLEKKQALLPLIHWHRIVIDEFHEIYTVDKYKYMSNLLPFFKSTYRWCVTGTPFEKSSNCLLHMVNFLSDYSNTAGDKIFSNNELVDHLSKNMFRRNTKKSIEIEHKLPPLEEETIMLKFTPTERMMYNAYLANPNNDKHSIFLRQLCCHPKISDETKFALQNCKTLKDIEKMMVSHYKISMDKSKEKLDNIICRITLLNKKISELEQKQLEKQFKKINLLKNINIMCPTCNTDKNSKLINKNEYLCEYCKCKWVVDNDSTAKQEQTNKNIPITFDLNSLVQIDIMNPDDKDKLKDDNLSDDEDDDDNIKHKTNHSRKKKNDKKEHEQDKIQASPEPPITKPLNEDDAINLIMSQIVGSPVNTVTIKNLKEAREDLENKKINFTKDYEGKKTTYEFYNNVINRLRKTATDTHDNTKNSSDDTDSNIMDMLSKTTKSDNDVETCGICLDEIHENDIGVTKCGHIFCYQCIKTIISEKHQCPYCRKNVKDSEVYMISYEMKKKQNTNQTSEDKDKETLTNEIGTKLANMIFFLRKNDKHTIIFSQWDDLLRKVGKILTENNIKNVFCRGSTYQKDKAIREFNDNNNIKVIMLSSESAASGTNLTKATQVILLDPVYGEYEYRRNTEGQAIGRAHRLGQTNVVKVIRFVIQDTIEEEIYNKNKVEDKKYMEKLAEKNKNVDNNTFNIGDYDLSSSDDNDTDKITDRKAKNIKAIKPKKKTTKKPIVIHNKSDSDSESDSDE